MHKAASKPPAILPSDRRSDRALFHVIAIFTLLLSLTFFALSAGMNTAGNWGKPLAGTLTVQVKPASNRTISEDIEMAERTIASVTGVKSVDVLSEQHAKDMLKPWLGDTSLPEDLPIPRLLNVQLNQQDDETIPAIKTALENTGVPFEIDDHTFWLKDLKRKTRLFQAALLLSAFLILAALISAIIFATRAGVTGWRTLVNVMDHIGAAPEFTARLFAIRFFKLSLKAGLIGAVGALVFALMISLFWAGSNWLGTVSFGRTFIGLALLALLLVAGLSAGTAWRTVYRTLMKRLYP